MSKKENKWGIDDAFIKAEFASHNIALQAFITEWNHKHILEITKENQGLEKNLRDATDRFIKDINTKLSEINTALNQHFIDSLKESKETEKTLKESVQKFLIDANIKIKEALDNTKEWLSEKFEGLNTLVKEKLDAISGRVDKRLEDEFKKTNETFKNIVERLAKIDEAQKNLDKISVDIIWLQNVLSDNKTKGIFGEVQMDFIMNKIFGSGEQMYETQYKLKNWTSVDFVVKTPQWLIPIDSKFSLTYYNRMYEEWVTWEDRKQAAKDFKSALKKQIDEISTKYVCPPETIETAFMFLPAEAIFSEVYAYHQDILDYAYTKKVSLVWPSTILAMLSMIFVTIKSRETQDNALQIQNNLIWLSQEFDRFTKRRGKFTKDYETVTKDIHEIDTTSDKILKKFSAIQSLKFDDTVISDLVVIPIDEDEKGII